MRVAYQTARGTMFHGEAERFIASDLAVEYRNHVDLILTSPPFPLNTKKRYGNEQGEEYVKWLAAFAPTFRDMLSPTGSIVLELGNAWEPGRPVMATLALEALLAFLHHGKLALCQQFVCENPARLPSPAQWVTIERIRVKDSFTHLWWMAPTDRPKANNRNILREYSPAMKRLLERKTYNAGVRPSEHNIGQASFKTDHGGAIPSNVLLADGQPEDALTNVLVFPNTASSDPYQQYCRQKNLRFHPARMPPGICEFFMRYLTDVGDLVMDPFAGSNTTGAVAESLGRRWIAVEPQADYVEGSKGRFQGNLLH